MGTPCILGSTYSHLTDCIYSSALYNVCLSHKSPVSKLRLELPNFGILKTKGFTSCYIIVAEFVYYTTFSGNLVVRFRLLQVN